MIIVCVPFGYDTFRCTTSCCSSEKKCPLLAVEALEDSEEDPLDDLLFGQPAAKDQQSAKDQQAAKDQLSAKTTAHPQKKTRKTPMEHLVNYLETRDQKQMDIRKQELELQKQQFEAQREERHTMLTLMDTMMGKLL